MKINLKLFFLLLSFVFFSGSILNASSIYFNEGERLFKKKDFKNSKFLFEKDIVFNPKSEKSYLYLAKIFKEENKDDLEENNLNTVLLLNPKNEEAIYLLTLLNIKKSNFSKAKELIKKMNLVCSELCSSKNELENKLKSSLKGK